MAPQGPEYSTEQWSDLCQKVKDLMPEAVGKEAWYFLIAAILTTSPTPSLLAPFATYLTTHDSAFSTKEASTTLSLRIRDILLKLTTLIGAPRVLGALIPLAAAEGSPAEKAKTSTLSEKWSSPSLPSISDRGSHTINTIYGPLLPRIFDTFGSHRADVAYMEVSLVYGLYLSDHTVLSAIETEVVVYASIICQGMRGPALWHTRGLGRVLGARGNESATEGEMDGVERERLERIKDSVRNVKVACMAVVEFVGEEYERRAEMQGWPNVGDVSRELGGWGDDEL